MQWHGWGKLENNMITPVPSGVSRLRADRDLGNRREKLSEAGTVYRI
jgi:hypothetical protein